MKAFHNKTEIKEKYINRIKEHMAHDEIVRRQYWEEDTDGVYRGCAVGCTVHCSSHDKYETELGIPSVLAHLQDNIFENLPKGEFESFPLEFLEAIPVGADLSLVWHRVAVWLLADPQYGLLQYNDSEDVRRVLELYEKELAGELVEPSEWRDAARAADVAANAAYAVAAAAARADVAAYAYAAAARTADVTANAAYAANADIARTAYAAAYTAAYGAGDVLYPALKEKLLEELKEAK